MKENIKNKQEDKDSINFTNAKRSTDKISRGLSILRYMETQMELPNQKFLDNDAELKKIFQDDANNAKAASKVNIEILLNEIDLIREYLLKRKEELQPDGG